jgi:RES domain
MPASSRPQMRKDRPEPRCACVVPPPCERLFHRCAVLASQGYWRQSNQTAVEPNHSGPLRVKPADWPEKTETTRALGDAWLARDSAALLLVPSAIVPETFNVLLNPTHKDAERIVIVQTGDYAIDPRLLK